MGLLDAYQDSTEQSLAVMAARPIDPEPPKPKHSGWSTIPRAVAGAFLETAGNLVDIANAYGQVQAATGANANPLIPDTPEDRKQRLDAYDRLKTEGIDWQPEESRAQYRMAHELRPDPLTAGTAENIVFGVTKGLTKAIGAGMITGPMAGAGVFGVSEGMTTAEDLAAQGVDVSTRTKVGAVTGALSAAGMALPVAGNTLTQTAGLVIAGGPASFVAQQMATRKILESADYGQLAQQYDPLDPVGLAVATLLPAGFGAWAMRGAFKGKPTAKPEPTAAPEHVDAAMVHNLTAHADSRPARERIELLRAWDEVHNNPIGPPDDPLVRLTPETIGEVLVERGTARLDTDGVTIRTGREGLVKIIVHHGPESGDVNPVTREDMANLPITMRQFEPAVSKDKNGRQDAVWVVERAEGGPLVVVVKEAARDSRNRLITMYADELNSSRPRSPKRKGPDPDSPQPSLASQTVGDTAPETFSRSPGSQEKSLDPNIAQAADGSKVGAGDTAARSDDIGQGVALAQTALNRLRRVDKGQFDTVSQSIQSAIRQFDELRASGVDVTDYLGRAEGIQPEINNLLIGLNEATGNPARIGTLLTRYAEQAAQPNGRAGMDIAADAVEFTRVEPELDFSVKPTSDASIAKVLSRAEDLVTSNPDMPVAFREDGTPVGLADEIDAIRRQAREGTADTFGADDASLVQVAVECMLSMGAA